MNECRNLEKDKLEFLKIQNRTNILQILQLLSPTEIYSPEQACTWDTKWDANHFFMHILSASFSFSPWKLSHASPPALQWLYSDNKLVGEIIHQDQSKVPQTVFPWCSKPVPWEGSDNIQCPWGPPLHSPPRTFLNSRRKVGAPGPQE